MKGQRAYGDKIFDLCIVGGGASGLSCAIQTAKNAPGISIILLEKMDEVGKKVSAAGNGRCNLSNVKCEDWEKTSAFFSSIGLMTKVDPEGRIYPYSEDGRDVTRCLKRAAENSGVEILARRQVVTVEKVDEGDESLFKVISEFNKPRAYREGPEDGPITVMARRIAMASGGKSKPKMGTNGDGYRILKELGHDVTKTIPVLTGVETQEDIKELGLSGIREKAKVSLYRNEDLIFQDSGEVQFTDYGISGIVIFDMTRYINLDSDYISIDFVPDRSTADLERIINEKNMDDVEALCSIVKRPLAEVIGGKRLFKDVPWIALKDFRLTPVNFKGWEMAQITRGGVPVNEINIDTMESVKCPGLYILGELVNIDGPCGGFNLQLAWTSGMKAGLNIAEKSK